MTKFDQYKKKYNDLFDSLLESIRKCDDKERDRILDERKELQSKMEKAYGKNALSRKAPIHRTYQMRKWQTKILAPAGTERFYEVRDCSKCGAGEAHHLAGHFVDEELYGKCKSGTRKFSL